MELETAAPADSGAIDEAPAPVFKGSAESLSPSEAARSVSDQRHKLIAKSRGEREEEETAAPVEKTELADEASAAPVEEQPSGENEVQEPAEVQPPIQAPNSWTKEEKEEFATYPREAQEKIARREQERESALRRSQNETAEKQKGLTAKEREIEQARAKYESALPALLETLQSERAGEFSDIKNMSDLEKLSKEDPFRYLQWTARQQKIAAVENQLREATDRQTQDHQKRWNDFAQREDDLVMEKIPELADDKKALALREKALGILEDLGFKKGELSELFNGKSSLSLRDHRVQQLVFESLKYREAKSAKAVAEKKTVPPVQKPGVGASRNTGGQAEIQALEKSLDTASGMQALRIGQRLTQLKRAAAR